MNGNEIVSALPKAALHAALFGWIDRVAPRVIQLAARNAPQSLSERLGEEWLADLAQRRGRMSQLSFALGCYWAATVIRHDDCTVKVPAMSSPVAYKTVTASAHHGPSLFSRRTTSAEQGRVVCDINITPLIDVMLVLLITLVVSLPIMTHAVRLDVPQTPPSTLTTRPEVIGVLHGRERPRRLESLRAARFEALRAGCPAAHVEFPRCGPRSAVL
jgi:biopolymer transport protein ExbD/TolR